MKNPEINPNIYGQMIFHKFNEERIVFSTNGARDWISTFKRKKMDSTSCYTQKLTQGIKKFKCKSSNYKTPRRKYKDKSPLP